MPSNKYDRKRKRELDLDTTSGENGDKARDRKHKHRSSRSRSRSPTKKSSKKQRRQQEQGAPSSSGKGDDESLSIEETNKLRAKLGLAPLEIDDKDNSEPVEKDDGSGEKVFTEDGVEIVHKPSRNWSDEKRQKDLKERLDTKKKQREVYSKILRAKRTLAEESDEEASDTAKWIEKNRRVQEEMRKAEQKAKMLDEMDEAFGVGRLIQSEQRKVGKTHRDKGVSSGGLVIGHDQNSFKEGQETFLVFQDKSILDEEDDEILINPNMMENERHKMNVEKRKKKATHYQSYEEEVDEFGQLKKQDILTKYDEGMDGELKRQERFRLDETGNYDLDKEAQELEAKRRLMMINKKFESLDNTKYTLAKEFYTEEEIIAFRRPKKKGTKNMRRKGKTLKADDLEPEKIEETEAERKTREAKLAARRAAEKGENGDSTSGGAFRDTMKDASSKGTTGGGGDVEEGELIEAATKQTEKKVEEAEEKEEKIEPVAAPPSKEKWKKAQASVDVGMLQSLADKMSKVEEEESENEDEFMHSTNVAPVRIEDDAEDELNAVLTNARRLRQQQREFVHPFRPKIEESDEEDMELANINTLPGTTIVFDATSEQYKSIGAGNSVGYVSKDLIANAKVEMEEEEEEKEFDNPMVDEGPTTSIITETTKKKSKRKTKKTTNKGDGGGWDNEKNSDAASDRSDDQEEMDIDEEEEEEEDMESGRKDRRSSSPEDDSTDLYSNILGEEKDVTKGVAAMLKLAGQKGYLEPGNRMRAGDGALKHLESKRFSKVDQGRFDIEEKTMRKLERMGTTGTGPTRPFPEKPDYKPKIEINYADKSGRILDPKEAFRVLSWKFHGKGPGKKQAEKHTMKVVKREKLKKMNSMDTPLGTLQKQLKKQEQLQTPYLVLTGRSDAAPLQKD